MYTLVFFLVSLSFWREEAPILNFIYSRSITRQSMPEKAP